MLNSNTVNANRKMGSKKFKWCLKELNRQLLQLLDSEHTYSLLVYTCVYREVMQYK